MTVEIITAILLAALVAAVGFLVTQIQQLRVQIEPLTSSGLAALVAAIR